MRDASCLIVYLALACALAAPSRAPGEELTLAEAERRALLHAPELAVQKTVVAQAEGARTTAGALPNPVVAYSREDLDRAGVAGGEWSVSVTAPLGFIWTRGAATRSADAALEGAARSLDSVVRHTLFDVRRAFLRYAAARHRKASLAKVAALFREASRAADARLDEGDISAYERRRIALETRRYDRIASEASLEAGEARRHLAWYLGSDYAGQAIEPDPGPLPGVVDVDREAALAAGQAKRADLAAARAVARAADAAYAAARREGLPPLSASFGFKRQEDGFEGTTLGVAVGLPFFDRNQGQVRSAGAARERHRLTVAAAERRVHREIVDAHARYRAAVDRLQTHDGVNEDARAILETVRVAYAEGEMPLVAFLDGLRAYHEAFEASLELETEYRISRFALELATGAPLDELKGTHAGPEHEGKP